MRAIIRSSFWQWYHTQYCLAANVKFADCKSVKFNDHSIISISPKSNVLIGKAFYMNSEPVSGIGTTMSKITVSEGATLQIGDYTGISSTMILVNNSVVIGNHVNIRGAVL